MLELTPADAKLVQALDLYQLLTIEQAVRLGVANRKHVGERLSRLVNAKCVGLLPTKIGRAGVYWLTERGANDYTEILPEGAGKRARKKPYTGGAHARQRIEIVDCHIALRQWAERTGWRIEKVQVEFERNTGKGILAPVTEVRWNGHEYQPDGLCLVTSPEGEPFVFALEVETGGDAMSLDNFRRKLEKRLSVLEDFGIEQAINWPDHNRAARMLFVFSTALMVSNAKRIVSHPDAPEWAKVGFKALPEVIEDFGSAWWQVQGRHHFPFTGS